ncbi:MAG: cytochrome c biogenesis protein CcsA [Planctomycetaceae bacterium]|jgi:ABC-type transport system involved in cytochrome c biogenesis permease subunit|nr:cytochrome c biogenesis protein CcsA [Planctomycetaceae bacterium]
MLFHRILLIITICSAIFQYSSIGLAQSGRVWGTTPVFDSGRVMPLHSFSKRIVREICGSSRPFIVRDDTILTELNRVIELQPRTPNNQENKNSVSNSGNQEPYRFLITGNDLLEGSKTKLSGSREAAPEQIVATTLAIHGLTANQAELIYQRIRALLPSEGRYFNADELVLSWLGEPEIWDYIPIFPAAEINYRTEVLDIPLQNNTRAVLQRVAVFQLKQSQRFQQRLADIERRRMQRKSAEVPILYDYDQITERINTAMMLYQELTFHPQRLRPTRMIDILQQTIDFSTGEHSSYTFALESWGHLLELGEVPARQSIKPNIPDQENENGLEQHLHPTTQRWHEIVRKIRLLTGAFDRINEYGEMVPPNLRVVEKHFEHLLKMIDDNFEESQALMESVYPESVYPETVFRRTPSKSKTDNSETINIDNSNTNDNNSNSNVNGTDVNQLLPLFHSPENKEHNKEVMKRVVLNYYYAIKTLRRNIETAYLALYDNGNSLRVLPVAALSAIGDTANVSPAVQPWGTMQMVLFGGDDFIRRFFNQDFHRDNSASSIPVPESVLAELSAIQNIITEQTGGTNNTKNNDNISVSDKEIANPTLFDLGTTSTGTEEKPKEPEEEKQWEKELFTENETSSLFLLQTRSSATQPSVADSISRIRADFISLLTAYTMGGRNRNINETAAAIQESLRNSAYRAESLREQFTDPENALMSEYVRKTSYPQRGSLNTEYRYQRLAPFFWMWVFAAGAVVFTGISLFLGKIRNEMIDDSSLPKNPQEKFVLLPKQDHTHSAEEYCFWTGIVLLCLSIFITFTGGVLRAWITGWAPVTNMYETIVLMAFSASLLGLWYSLYPLIHPVIQLAWRSSSFPNWRQFSAAFRYRKKELIPEQNSVFRQAASDFGLPGGVSMGMKRQDSSALSEEERREQLNQSVSLWQIFLFVPRLVLMLLTFLFVVNISYGDYAHEHGTVAAILELLKMSDFIDWLVVIASIVLIVWFVPQLILTTILVPVLLCRPSRIAAELGIVSPQEETTLPSSVTGQSVINSVFHGETIALGNTDRSGNIWLSSARNQILNRKLFVIVAASIALLAGLASYFNTAEFNPEIKPVVALLRSNFWLTVHVIAIIVSYAAALVAWGMAVVGLGNAVFGRYRYTDIPSESPATQASATQAPAIPVTSSRVRLPVICDMFAPIIHRLLQLSLVLLILGTVLGARWADYSWGRFWSWDPKEVWALITIFFYVIVLHGQIARFYGRIGVMVGALFASIAVIMTWYGINFVFKGSLHSYGGGAASNAAIFLLMFVIINILWGSLAIFRYSAEVYGHETE